MALNRLLQKPVSVQLLDTHTCLTWIQDVNRAYADLKRWLMPADEVVALKLRVIYWRWKVLNAVLQGQVLREARDDGAMHEVLSALNVYLTPAQRQKVSETVSEYELAKLSALQGEATQGYPNLDLISGPGINLNIVANRSSHWTFEKWRENSRFCRYQFEREGVRYRGMLFLPGDVLLANVNLDGNGVYTALSDPKSFSSHSAFVALFTHANQRFPVIIETYEKGVRPVPLNVFLGPRFSSYVEIYRHNEYSPAYAEKINSVAMKFVRTVRGYNFDSEDPDVTYMSCTAVGRMLHEQAGLQPAETKSRIAHPNIQTNLRKLGYTYFDFFAPVDFLLNECFHFAGYVDNNQIDRLLARELIDQEFRTQFTQRTLEPKKFPFPYALNRWGIGQIRKQTVIGKLIGMIEGFDDQNLPKGPDDLLAVIKLAERQIGRSIKAMREPVSAALFDCEDLDMQSLAGDHRVQHALRQSLRLPWLRPASGAG